MDASYGNLYDESKEKCESATSKVIFRQFFEDVIPGGGSPLFDCQMGGIGIGIGIGMDLVYSATHVSQILLVNMLIAVMNKAFLSVHL